MQAGRMITASIRVSDSQTCASLAPSSFLGLMGRDARNTESRPRYRELMIKKNAMISVPAVLRKTARSTSRSRISTGFGAPSGARYRKSSALVSMMYRNTPK